MTILRPTPFAYRLGDLNDHPVVPFGKELALEATEQEDLNHLPPETPEPTNFPAGALTASCSPSRSGMLK